ncbi:YrhB domain-containing protein [Streptomyces fuscigenes]|uniref:YrhB domain-containing protein n=1 Tax=Streptomyces fuscigenes TaxID=1528880 RepID=UPI001F3221B1|nr:YrhB domain-containing protein [Streptomyces fuscigenes]MCF3962121.1 YrhB family protein [Streptomyces fuscigenes]
MALRARWVVGAVGPELAHGRAVPRGRAVPTGTRALAGRAKPGCGRSPGLSNGSSAGFTCGARTYANSWQAGGIAQDAARAIEREAAVRAVEERLERNWQPWREVDPGAVRMPVVAAEEHELVWIVLWNSEEFARTRARTPRSSRAPGPELRGVRAHQGPGAHAGGGGAVPG